MATKKRKQESNKDLAEGGLSPSHYRFVLEYIGNGGHSTFAYQKAYPGTEYMVAAAAASRLLKNVKIKKAIEDGYKKFFKDKDSELEKSKTYQMIHNLGTSDISHIISINGGSITVRNIEDLPAEIRQWVQSIKVTEKETKYGMERFIDVKLHPKFPWVELRAKIQGLIQDKTEFTGDIIVRPIQWGKAEEEKQIENKSNITDAELIED